MVIPRLPWDRLAFSQDSTGFVRRACPACARHFKLGPPLAEDTSATTVFIALVRHANVDELRGPPTRFCPYCGFAATADRFLTKAQRDYLEARARLLADTVSLAPPSDGQAPWEEQPRPAPEPDDMRPARLMCCADELKLKGSWMRPFFCPHCRLRHGTG